MSIFTPIRTTLLLILFFYQPLFADSATNSQTTYHFGVVPQFNATQIVKIWRPILDVLQQETGVNLKLAGSDSISTFEQEFAAGKFDFVYMNPYHFVLAQRSQGYQPLLRDIGKKLYGIIVVHKESTIQKVKDLDGKLVVFPSPNALGASLMPRAEFQNIHHIEIRPSYVLSHSSVYLNVALGKADAGGGVQKTLQQQPKALREMLRIIHRTREVVPHPIAVHPRVNRIIRDKIKQTLLDMGSTLKGQQLLSRVPIKKIGMASTEDYYPLLELGLESFYQGN